jgi:calcineurin-like phosphoesterase family protein
VVTTHFISDPHFFHASPDKPDGIIRMCNRPFANGREMNEAMAASWRAMVRRDDDVIVLGDFAHRAKKAEGELRKLFESLPGRKYLVAGNHDDEVTKSLGWEWVRDIAYVNVESTLIVACHYPMLSWKGSRKPTTLMLYGHHHGKLPGNQQSCDVGVDVLGWAPLRLSQIKTHMSTLPARVDPELSEAPDIDRVKP